MTREDQVTQAINLLKPTDRAACVKYVDAALDDLEITKAQNQHLHDIASKEARTSLTAYRNVLRRAQIAYKRLPSGLKQTLGSLGRRDGHGDINFGALSDICDSVLAAPHARSKKDYVKYNAAYLARNVLNLLDIESPLTHEGKWPALAAILHGDARSDDLFHHCSEYNDASRNDHIIASRNSGSK